MKKSGVHQENLKAFLVQRYGIDSTKEIQREWYEEICDNVEAKPDEVNSYGEGMSE